MLEVLSLARGIMVGLAVQERALACAEVAVPYDSKKAQEMYLKRARRCELLSRLRMDETRPEVMSNKGFAQVYERNARRVHRLEKALYPVANICNNHRMIADSEVGVEIQKIRIMLDKILRGEDI